MYDVNENVDCGCLGWNSGLWFRARVIIGEDLIEGHSCTMCVVLLVTVGVGVLGTVQVN